MKCGRCGKTLKESETICDRCGVVVPYGPEPVVHSSWWDRILVTLGIGSIGSVLLLGYFTYEPPKETCPKDSVDFCRRMSQELRQGVTPQKLDEVAKYPKEMLQYCVELKNKGCFE